MKRLPQTTKTPSAARAIRLAVLSAAAALAVAGCGSAVGLTNGDTSEAPVASFDPVVDSVLRLPDGWFEMAGYGTVLHVDGDSITEHHQTASTCVVGDSFENEIPVDHAGVLDGGVMVVDLVGPTTDYRLLRLVDGLECKSEAPESVAALDEVFRRHYPFFAERDVDWDASIEAIRAAVEAEPSSFEPELAAFMVELSDGHTTFDYLSIDPDPADFALPGVSTIDEAITAMAAESDATLSRVDDLQADPSGSVGWGTLDDSVGYLLLAGFQGPSGGDDPVADREALTSALDTAIADLASRTDRLVVDARFNPGGYEDFAVLAAGYFVSEATPGYRKWAHAQPDPSVQVIQIEPQAAYFGGDVVVLTSPATASAAEAFVLAMVEVADATVVGNRSFGEFSDAIDWVLPNGIGFTMSMEIYTDLGGVGYEAVGVPVDIESPLDGAVDAAVEFLN